MAWKPIHALEQLGRLRVSDTLAMGLCGDNDSQCQAVIENDNENHSQAAGTEKPQWLNTGARGLGADNDNHFVLLGLREV